LPGVLETERLHVAFKGKPCAKVNQTVNASKQ
jgi:hypothetical protein